MSEELPTSWTTVPLSAITVDTQQRVPEPDEQIVYIDIGSVDRITKTIKTPQILLGSAAPSRARKQVATGDTLVAMTRPNLNAVALVSDELDGQIASTGFDVLRPVLGIDPRWIVYLVRTDAFVKAMSSLVQGALYPAVRSKDVRAYEVPLAPKEEQIRIADQLDTLLARVNACNDRLDAIPGILKRFRQAVFSAATSGRLTESWRQAGSGEWAYERAADVCAKVQSGGTPKEGFTQQGIPFLKVYNLVNQNVAFDYKPQYIAPAVHAGSMAKSKTQPGDVLMNIVGPPLGKVAIVPDSHPMWNINQALTLFRPSDKISTGWLYCILCGGANIANITHETRGSAGQINISLSQCRDFLFPIPSIEEQTEIVRRVEALFSLADHIEARLTTARTLAQRLTPRLLSKAFRGELVTQDPSDEPATELLNRVAVTQTKKPTKRTEKNVGHVPRNGKPQSDTASIVNNGIFDKSMKLDAVPSNYLAALVTETGGMHAKELWLLSKLSIDDFYVQLSSEISCDFLVIDSHDESKINRAFPIDGGIV